MLGRYDIMCEADRSHSLCQEIFVMLRLKYCFFCVAITLSLLSHASEVSTPGTPTVELLEQLPDPVVETTEQSTIQPSTNQEPEASEATLNPDGIDWAALGYSLFWESTPTAADLNGTAIDFFTGPQWSNGHPLRLKKTLGTTMAPAPDGSPAVQVITLAGTKGDSNFRGEQFGPDSIVEDAVFQIDVWVDNPTTRSYIGVGHIWGTRDGVYPPPSGGNQRDDGFTIRGVSGLNNGRYSQYVYDCENTKSFGDTTASSHSLITGEWVTLQMRIKLNSPVSEANAEIDFYNGTTLMNSTADRIRCYDDVYFKGFGFFVHHVTGAPEDETLWARNWKIWTK